MKSTDSRLHLQHATLVSLAQSRAMESGDFQKTLQELTEALTRTQQVQRASIWLYTAERDGIACLDLHEAVKNEHAAGVVLKQNDFPGYFRALEEERTIAADDAHTDPRTREFSTVYLAPLGINSMLDAPIRHRGKMVGVVCQEHVGPARSWTQDEQNFAGSVADFVSLALEANERIKAEKALAQQVEELARSNAELEQFAYVASHDLQEPLRMVSNYVSLLERKYKGKLDPDADKYIRYAVEGATRMHRMIEDLLTFSRSARDEQSIETVDAQAVAKDVLANLARAAEEARAEILVHPLPTFRARGPALSQILQNLIENAIKYRGDAAPRIEVKAERSGDDWRFSVSDNGIGIDPQHSERVFRIFQRLHERGKYSGTGIGLAIVKRIVESQKGTVWVESTVGQGSTFHFTLPAEA